MAPPHPTEQAAAEPVAAALTAAAGPGQRFVNHHLLHWSAMNDATADHPAWRSGTATTTDADPFAAAVAREADGMLGLLAVARALAEGGRDVALAGLDEMVGRLCARALDLGPEQGRRLRPRLHALLVAAAALEAAIRATDFRPTFRPHFRPILPDTSGPAADTGGALPGRLIACRCVSSFSWPSPRCWRPASTDQDRRTRIYAADQPPATVTVRVARTAALAVLACLLAGACTAPPPPPPAVPAGWTVRMNLDPLAAVGAGGGGGGSIAFGGRAVPFRTGGLGVYGARWR